MRSACCVGSTRVPQLDVPERLTAITKVLHSAGCPCRDLRVLEQSLELTVGAHVATVQRAAWDSG